MHLCNKSSFLTLVVILVFLLKSILFAQQPLTENLPNVLIIGDSISIGYTPFVKEILQDKAVVQHNPGNAGHTGMGLDNLEKWLSDTHWDVIHFNWGLWDLCYRHPDSKNPGQRDKINGTLTHTPEQYEQNLRQLVKILKATQASLIWATTTPVPDNEAGRFKGDAVKYNQVAARVMRENDIPINDLYARAFPQLAEYQLPNGDVHFTREGYRFLAQQVAEQITKALQPPYTPTSDYTPMTLEGFPILINNELLHDHPELAQDVITLAHSQLFHITQAIPAQIVTQLKTVKIWIEYNNPECPGACHHPSRQWLIEHNYNPEKEDSIEIGNARNFLNWSRQQPAMILHEMAHAYHHQFLGNNHPRIRAAFLKARDNGKYDNVLHIAGQSKKAYAMNNDMEYFAESTEAFFGTNDFYPFVRAELRQFDPDMYEVLQEVWQTKSR